MLKTLALAAIFAVGAWFVATNVFRYYLHYTPEVFRQWWPWARRFGLLLHITGGMVALLIGPWQFSQRLRQWNIRLHRWLGHTYLIAILAGAAGALYLAATTPFGWGWGIALGTLALAWLTTSGMAFYAIKNRMVQIHREWMIRSYVVTFGFVTFRILGDIGVIARLGPPMENAIARVWVAWTMPLLAAEVIMQLMRMRTEMAARARRA